ncbi:MAG: Na+/H+ antiporter NhaA [Planctomycetota bacterium]|nr:Na+/H+ antiporter NhaA [Planctomycetota bacterium]
MHQEPQFGIKWLQNILHPFRRFAKFSAAGGILLLVATVLAMALANLPTADWYFHLWHQSFQVKISSLNINQSLLHWVNDGLMTIFFLLVGLEIKREIISGHLSSPSKMMLPLAAAIGGMLGPAAIFYFFNQGTPEVVGWGIPMATDIAFALGILMLLGNRVPSSLKIFLAAFAIFDDIGAVLVIAIFYTDKLSFGALGLGIGLIVLLFVLARFGVRNLIVFLLIGLVSWVAFLKSGVHTTVQGVLLAMTIPATAALPLTFVRDRGRKLIDEFDKTCLHPDSDPKRRKAVLTAISNLSKNAMSPLMRLEHALHPFVTFVILPIFAFANAGVAISFETTQQFMSMLSLGIVAGLFFGKSFMITTVSYLAVKLRIAKLPKGVKWKHIFGVAILGGIGFTMSLFITSLAFTEPESLESAKIGVLTASTLSAIVGSFVLVMVTRNKKGEASQSDS